MYLSCFLAVMTVTREVGSTGEPSRRCRVSMARTTLVVQRATSTWSQIFQFPHAEFRPTSVDCSSLAKEVKLFLSDSQVASQEATMAFQSIKKLLPPSCKCQEKGLLLSLRALLTKRADALPAGYLSFVKTRTASLFRKGWDVGSYDNFCRTVSPGLAGTTDSSRRQGGCQGEFSDHAFFMEATTGDTPYEVTPVANLMVVQSAGKPRPLTKFSAMELLLKPLHKTIYDRLSRTRWVCRGEPTDEVLKRAGFRSGGTLVSGDYKSATDNLPLEVTECILDVILENAVSVPDSVKEHARKVLRPLLVDLEAGHEFEINRGQMMGSFLSFPLLCLQNYFCFEWARKGAGLERMPLLINGDDILFETWSESFPEEWMNVVGKLGLEVERTKTSVSNDYGSLNSTLFCWNEDGSLVNKPTLRFGMLRSPDFPMSLGTTYHSFVRGQSPEILWRATRAFFSWHLVVMKSVRLQPDELGFRGALAFRMARIFGLIQDYGEVVVAPRPPIDHNIVLSSDEVTMIDDRTLSDELRQQNNREMASWKFRQDFQDLRCRAALRYCLALSAVRPWRERIPTIPRWKDLTPSFSWRRLRKRYFRPRDGVSKMVPVFDSVLQSQDVDNTWSILPPYSECEEEQDQAWPAELDPWFKLPGDKL